LVIKIKIEIATFQTTRERLIR